MTAAHRYQTVNLMALETRTFVSRHAAEGAPGVRIPQTYLDELAPWMEAYEKNAYAPDEDWDEDGADNFTEYLSGTNPFDPSDKLTIVAFRAVPASSAAGFRLDGSLMSLSFESVGGHTYSVLATPELARPQWATKSFSTAADGAKAQTKFTAAGSEADADLVTLYLLPTAEANQEFLKVKPE